MVPVQKDFGAHVHSNLRLPFHSRIHQSPLYIIKKRLLYCSPLLYYTKKEGRCSILHIILFMNWQKRQAAVAKQGQNRRFYCLNLPHRRCCHRTRRTRGQHILDSLSDRKALPLFYFTKASSSQRGRLQYLYLLMGA